MVISSVCSGHNTKHGSGCLVTAKLSPDTQRAQGESSPHAKLPERHVQTRLRRSSRPLFNAKRDFDSGDKEFQINFVVTCYFR
jgi:hypothetical protein